jgi:hypothetical protein
MTIFEENKLPVGASYLMKNITTNRRTSQQNEIKRGMELQVEEDSLYINRGIVKKKKWPWGNRTLNF